MPDHPTTPGAVWRLLVFDPDPGDPKWLIAVVVGPADVRPGSAQDDPEVIASWVAARTGAAGLDPLPGSLAWRVSP